MRIIIFGTGDIYERNRDKIAKSDEIIALFDNDIRKQGNKLNGILIHSPYDINNFSYDKVVIMSRYFNEMRRQLLEIGCSQEDIVYYPEYICNQQIGHLKIYFGEGIKSRRKKGLIITSPIGYHGGALTAVYAALELQKRDYEMTVAAPYGDEQFIEEFQKQGIIFLLYPNLQFAKWKELFWIQQFQKIIINTYPMALCALEISRYRNILFWLHESDTVYASMDFWKDFILEQTLTGKLDIYAVSSVAKRNFENHITKCDIGILPYGIPDVRVKNKEIKNKKLCFAVVGTLQPIKRQLMFLDAIELLETSERRACEFLIIGDAPATTDYAKQVRERAKARTYVKILGNLTRKELEQIYIDIDILVVSAEQETMSLVATESMMYGKVCILCDVAGMAEYIEHGRNGLLYKTDNIDSLVEQMKFCVHNQDRLTEIGENARDTYGQYFTMNAFGERLEKALKKIES